jgi:starch synthase
MSSHRTRRLRVLFVSAEAAPLAKVGGLADVVGALPKALGEAGHDVRVALPHYGLVDRAVSEPPETVAESLRDPILTHLRTRARVSRTSADGIPTYLVATDRWFGGAMRSEDLYTSDPAAYAAFGRVCALIATEGVGGWRPDVLHCHDWHAGLTPVYCRACRPDAHVPSVFTVHNLAYSGQFGREIMDVAALPAEMYTMDGLEYYGGFSFLKAGMVFSDCANTVSPRYAREVATDEYGGGLAGLVRHLDSQGRFSGILNGIDSAIFDPAADDSLPARYSPGNLSGKAACKQALQADLGLRNDPGIPILGMVSRICDQKGHDVVAEAAEAIAGLGAQLVILGVGDARMSDALVAAAARRPTAMAVRIGYDAYLASRIYAGCDMFLMPSRFEPCGLGQLISLRYGTVPVVRETGGLADTVRDIATHPAKGNGFVFPDVSAASMLGAIARAVQLYRGSPDRWRRLVVRGMREDHGCRRAAESYAALYARVLAGSGASVTS